MPIDFDITWRNPTDAQLAALEFAYHAHGKKPPELKPPIDHHWIVNFTAHGRALAVDADIFRGDVFHLTEYDLAELILLSKDSLWYKQAEGWSKTPPDKVPLTWAPACQFLVDVVNLGYDGKQWWDLAKLGDRVSMGRLLLLDLKQMLVQYRQHRMDVVSRGFEAFIDLICDKPWLTQMRQKVRANTPYSATKCIKPECENLVAPTGQEPQSGHFRNYRGLGSCCREHRGYDCPKCQAPHSYSTKIGKKHYAIVFERNQIPEEAI